MVKEFFLPLRTCRNPGDCAQTAGDGAVALFITIATIRVRKADLADVDTIRHRHLAPSDPPAGPLADPGAPYTGTGRRHPGRGSPTRLPRVPG